MVNTNELNFIQKRFEKEIELNKQLPELEIGETTKIESKKSINSEFEKEFLENKFYSQIKKIVTSKKNLEIFNDTILNIKGSGNLNIRIKDNLTLTINFEDNNFNLQNITIIVEKNKHLELIEYCNSQNNWKTTNICLDKNAQVNNQQIIFNSKLFITNSYLKQNSSYNLYSVYYHKNSQNYILNSAIHKEEDTKSDLIINGAVSENSKTINDGLIKITQKAKKSNGYQTLNNTLLDDNSTILSEPLLEIENFNVKCSHGCSISQIKEDILFYMQTRGLTKKKAIKIVIEGYINQVISKISNKQYNSLIKEKTNLYLSEI